MKERGIKITNIEGNKLNPVLGAGLTLDQAKTTAIVEGKKIKHRYFMEHEFIYYKNGCWFTEDNYQMPDSYWGNMDENWQDGWSYVD